MQYLQQTHNRWYLQQTIVCHIIKAAPPNEAECRFCEVKVKRGDSCILSPSRRPRTPKLWALAFVKEAYLLFYGVHSAVVVILDYASTMRPNQNSSCSSALAQSVSLDISSLILTEEKTFVNNTYARHNKLSASLIGVDCSQVRLLKLLKNELE